MKQYCTYEQAINFGGFRPEDLDESGYEMNESQLKAYVESLIRVATQIINKYCNRNTFEITEYVDEMHTLDIGDSFTPIYGMVRGYPGLTYSINLYDYTTDLSKFTIIPREQPVVEIESLKVNTAWSNAKPQWEELHQWTLDSDGEYKVIERYGTTRVMLMKRFPCPSNNNIRLTYKSGYQDNDPVWDILSVACSMIVSNIINKKKTNQERFTIRGAGVESYQGLFDTTILTPDVKSMLDLYVKDPMGAFCGQ